PVSSDPPACCSKEGGWPGAGSALPNPRTWLAPRDGFEPSTQRLTAACSTTELPGIRARPQKRRGIVPLEAGSGIEPLYTDLQSNRGRFPIIPETAIPVGFQSS